MANAFLAEKVYANTMLMLLKNRLVLGRLVDGSLEDKVTNENGLKIYKKRPPRFIAKSGAALAKQDIIVGEESVTVDQYKNVHLSVGDLENVQSFDDLTRNTSFREAATTLAHDVDNYLHGFLKKFPSYVGTAGQLIKTAQQFNVGHTRLMNQSVPNEDLKAVISYDDAAEIRGQLIGSNIDGTNKSALERSRVPILSEVDIFATQQISSFTNGTRTNGLVAGAAQNVNYRTVKNNSQLSQTLNIDGVGIAGTIKAGERFTLAGVFAYNNRSQQANDYLQQFVVLADATADGAGAATVTISPPIIVPGTNDGVSTDANTAFATVSAAPADNAAVTFFGAASAAQKTKAVFHKKAVSLVSAKLAMPFTGVASFARDPETGIFIRYWRGSDIATGDHIHRWDMIYGAEMMDNRLGTLIAGAV